MELPQSYKQAVFNELGGSLSIEEVELKLPNNGEVLVKVEACGVCHSEVFAQHNVFGGGFPKVPGHELIGRVVAVGGNVTGWQVGDRIGGGYHGGHDGVCDACIMGLPQMCEPYIVNGVTRDGGCKSFPDCFADNSHWLQRTKEHCQSRNTASCVQKQAFGCQTRLTQPNVRLYSAQA